MKNLWLFLVRYNAIFLFIIFFMLSLFLVVQNNNYQRSSFINSSNTVVGSIYSKLNSWQQYLNLANTNKDLMNENALLREKLSNLMAKDTSNTVQLVDSIDQQQYDFIVAGVVNNSVNQKSNYITINKGSNQGIKKNMGVITSNGIVGTVLNVSKNFSTIKSLLHPGFRSSVMLDSTGTAIGSLGWGNNVDSRYAVVKDIPNHVKMYIGQPIFTSGFSNKFPKGIKVGHIVQLGISSGGSFQDVKIMLTTNFSNLHHVYIVRDKFAEEKTTLESLNSDNG